jgi:cellulose biosynthesis protein BcsQ
MDISRLFGDMRSRLATPVVRKYGKVMHIVIWSQPVFAYELAYVMAKGMKKKVVLVNGDLFSPFISDFSRTDATIQEPHSSLHPMDLTGLNLMMNAVSEGKRDKKMIHRYINRHPKTDLLSMLTGNYRPENAEFCRLENYQKVLDLLKDEYDVLVENVSPNLYDEISCNGMLAADVVLFAKRLTLADIRSVHEWVLFLERFQGFDPQKAYLVAWDYPYRLKSALRAAGEVTPMEILGSIPMNRGRDHALLKGERYLPRRKVRKAHRRLVRKLLRTWSV